MPGGWEWLIIIGVLVLLFGAKRLPEMARSVGQSARVFKGEMKGLKDDEGRTAAPSNRATRAQSGTRPAAPAEPAALPPVDPQVDPGDRRTACPASRRPSPSGATPSADPCRVKSPGLTGPRGRLRPGRRRRLNPDGTMTLIEHLFELRNRLGIALVAIAVTTVFGYIWFGVGLFGTPSLGEILKAPYCAIPAASRATFTADGSCTLLGTGPVRPVQPAAQGRHHRRGRAGLPDLALPALAVHHPRPATRTNAATRWASSRRRRCCSSPGRCWPTSSSPRAWRSC